MKNITNKKLNHLTVLASTLQPLQRKNANGSMMFRDAQKRIMGKDLPDSYKKSNEYFPDKWYILKYKEAVLVDHKLNLVETYEKRGDKGVEEYITSLNKFVSKNKTIANTIKLGLWQKIKNKFKQKTPK